MLLTTLLLLLPVLFTRGRRVADTPWLFARLRQIAHLTGIIASEMRDNREAIKVLSFLLYREQISTNRRPCIPAGAEAYHIYRDIIESCINTRVRVSVDASLSLSLS